MLLEEKRKAKTQKCLKLAEDREVEDVYIKRQISFFVVILIWILV